MKSTLILIGIFFSLNSVAFTATYEIPTDVEEEKPFAISRVDQVNFTAESLTFKLPPEVASEDALVVKFERDENNPNQFNSAFGSAKCLQEGFMQVRCEVRYNKVYSNFLKSMLPSTLDHIDNLPLPLDEIAIRKDLVRRFSGDPIGFLVIDLY